MNAGRAHEWATPKGGDLEPLGWSPHLPGEEAPEGGPREAPHALRHRANVLVLD